MILRLMHGESNDSTPFYAFRGLLEALPDLSPEDADAAEVLAALRLLRSLGLDAGDMPGLEGDYDADALAAVSADRRSYISRVNRGIGASGL